MQFVCYCGIVLLLLCSNQIHGQTNDTSDTTPAFTIERDWKYNSDNPGSVTNASSFSECLADCYENINCVAFTWSTSFRHLSGNRCYLKSNIDQGGRKKRGYISGYRPQSDYKLRGATVEKVNGNQLSVTDKSGQKHTIANRFGWSVHNCDHDGSKTGVVLYPTDTKFKNTVILRCRTHYGYKSTSDRTQHQQLHDWYFTQYANRKNFRLASGFSVKDDGSLGFNSLSLNADGPYTNNQREMSSLEQDIVRKVVTGKLDTYTVT